MSQETERDNRRGPSKLTMVALGGTVIPAALEVMGNEASIRPYALVAGVSAVAANVWEEIRFLNP